MKTVKKTILSCLRKIRRESITSYARGLMRRRKTFPAHSARGFVDRCGDRLQLVEPDISAHGGCLLTYGTLDLSLAPQ